MNLKEITLNYFTTFSNKDIDGLRCLFSDDIYLRDWTVQRIGVDNVIGANKEIFDSVDTITIIPIQICETEKLTMSEIVININNTETLNVVDIIEFDEEGKICAVRAYKG